MSKSVNTVKAVRSDAEWFIIDRGNGHSVVVRLDRVSQAVTGLAYSGKFEPTQEERTQLDMSMEAYMDLRDALTDARQAPIQTPILFNSY